MEKLDKLKRRDSKKSLLRKYDKSASRLEDDELPQSDDHVDDAAAEPVTEDYWFICRRWLARSEDDGKIVRELIATDESGNPLEGGLKGKTLFYSMKIMSLMSEDIHDLSRNFKISNLSGFIF